MIIDELYNLEEIGIRTYNICFHNELKDLTAILGYYRENGTFTKLRRCGRNTNEELLRLCFKHKDHFIIFDNEIIKNENSSNHIVSNLNQSQIEILNNFIESNINSLSIRSQNGIRYYLRKDLSIINFDKKILTNKNFEINKLKNIGKKSVGELNIFINTIKKLLGEVVRNQGEQVLDLCQNQEESNILTNKEILIKENSLSEIVSKLTLSHREIINSFIEINIKSLSVRSQNAISSFLDNNLNIRNISKKILTNESFNIYKLKHIGTKSADELNNFINAIQQFTKELSSIESEKDLSIFKNKFLFKRAFPGLKIPIEILESQSIFILIDYFINNNLFYDKNQSIIFLKAFKIYNNQPQLTLEEIAKELNITRERVRQIKNSSYNLLFERLNFVKNINDDLLQKYNIDYSLNYIFIDILTLNKINEINKTNFSKEFISYLVYTYWHERFELIGNIEDVFHLNNYNFRNRHNWNNFYLVYNYLNNEFDFIAFVDDVNTRLNDRIEETYSFNFKSYLSKFLKSSNYEILNSINQIAEKIIDLEFGLYINLEDNIEFQRNTAKQVYEFAIEALEKLEKPTKIEEIYKLIEMDHPEITKSQDALRGSLNRTQEIIYFGRTSTYGLKKWENEMEGIKGGTIRSMTEEFLQLSDKPLHISEIGKNILIYRPNTNEKNILYNLKMDESGIFQLYKNSYLGLTSKKYDESFVILKDTQNIVRKSWEQSFNEFTEFLNINDRIPFSSGCTDDEIKLYRWYKIQVGKYNKGELSEVEGKLIRNISDNYDQKTNRKRKDRYKELQQFILNNKRLPSANKTGENNLYAFYYKQRKLFDADSLEKMEKDNYIEITKLLYKTKL